MIKKFKNSKLVQFLWKYLVEILYIMCGLIIICQTVYLGEMRKDLLEYDKELKEQSSQLRYDEECLYSLYDSIEMELYELDVIYRIADEYDLEPELILAMMKVESNFYQYEETGDCKGLMQISDIHNIENIFDLETNIRTGASLISGLRAESDNMYQALGKYNYGKTGYKEYVKRTGTEVTEYAEKVLSLVDELHNK